MLAKFEDKVKVFYKMKGKKGKKGEKGVTRRINNTRGNRCGRLYYRLTVC